MSFKDQLELLYKVGTNIASERYLKTHHQTKQKQNTTSTMTIIVITVIIMTNITNNSTHKCHL